MPTTPIARLVYETPGSCATSARRRPIAEIADLHIGSRARLAQEVDERIEDLRAIPWVFSWAQCRLMLPGWYGFGTAVEALDQARPRREWRCCRQCTRDWPFFQTLLSNMDMVLAKSDIAIARATRTWWKMRDCGRRS